MQAVPDYFTSILASTPIDDSTKSYDWAEYRTSSLNIAASGLSQGNNNYYQIQIKDINQWLLLSKGYLRVQAKLATQAGAELADTTAGAVTLGAAAAGLFARMELRGNDSQIDICENPQFVQLINALMNYSKDQLRTNASSEWLHLDFGQPSTGAVTTGVNQLYQNATDFGAGPRNILEHTSGCAIGRMGLEPAAAGAQLGTSNPYFNPGWLARWNRSRRRGGAGTSFEVIIPLASVFGFCRDIQSVQRGMKWELNLTKNLDMAGILHGFGGTTDAFANAAVPATTILTKISLWVPQVEPSDTTSLYLEKALGSSDVVSKQYFENMTCRISEEYPAGTTDVEWLLPLEGSKPTRMVFGFQRAQQYKEQNDVNLVSDSGLVVPLNDQTHANPSTFSHMGAIDTTFTIAGNPNPNFGLVTGGITEVELRVNTDSLPREKYRISFSDAAPEYERVYADFLKSSGKFVDESGSAVSYKDYKDLYPLFAFDLRDYAGVYSGFRSNDVRFRARLQGAQATAFRVVMVIYSERELIVQPIDGKISLKV